MAKQRSLDEKNAAYCRRICKKVEGLHFKPKRNDYPAMAVIVEKNGIISEAHSSRNNWYSISTRHYIETVLGGAIGEKSSVTNCDFHIGNCAEQHASEYLSRKTLLGPLSVGFKQLKFSTAMRPRTMEEFPKCDNCKLLFE